jgi:hypothetical protein
MPSCTNVVAWRVATNEEVLEFLRRDRSSPTKKTKRRTRSKRVLIIRTHLRPVDVYSYLRARFGPPNGFQNALRRDDSDNWIHWDFNIKAGQTDVYIAGTSRTVQVMTSEDLSDNEWKDLVIALKVDFARVAKQKSAMTRSFEKFVVFQNKFVALSGLCAEMHEAISDTEPAQAPLPKASSSERQLRRYYSAVAALGKRADHLYGHCLTLRLLTPIMAEAFLNMLIVTLCKKDIRDDQAAYDVFVRAKIPARLEPLSKYCDGFAAEIDKNTEGYAAFMRVMNLRNFAVHGNVDPVREQIETVYFEGRRPLFVDGGDNITKLFEHLEQINRPSDVIRDYEAVHGFLHELTTYLSPRYQQFFRQVITAPYPGYETRTKRVTRLFPDHSMSGYIGGLTYDDELKVSWE